MACASSRGFAVCLHAAKWTVSRVLSRRAVAPSPARIIHLGDALPRRSSALTRTLAPHELIASASGGSPSTSAPIRVCSQKGLPRRRSPGCRAWALTPRFHPYLCELNESASHRRCNFCCAFPRVAPGRRYRLLHPMEPGLSSHGRFVSAGDPPSTSGGAERRRRANPGQFQARAGWARGHEGDSSGCRGDPRGSGHITSII